MEGALGGVDVLHLREAREGDVDVARGAVAALLVGLAAGSRRGDDRRRGGADLADEALVAGDGALALLGEGEGGDGGEEEEGREDREDDGEGGRGAVRVPAGFFGRRGWAPTF